MTYWETLLHVLKWVGYMIWTLVSIVGTLVCTIDIASKYPTIPQNKLCFFICLVSLIFLVAFVIYKRGLA